MATPWSQSIPEAPQGLTVATDPALGGNHSLKLNRATHMQAAQGRPSSAQKPPTELWLPASDEGLISLRQAKKMPSKLVGLHFFSSKGTLERIQLVLERKSAGGEKEKKKSCEECPAMQNNSRNHP